MARWFRMHETTLDDPKVQRLPDVQFKAWVNLLCLACRHDGVLPPLADVAFALRRSEETTSKLLDGFKSAELIDEIDGTLRPHNWNGRQYKSDVSNERVKQHRQRKRNVTGNGHVTPSENRDREQSSEAKASGGQVPPRDVIFSEGLPWLMRKSGKSRDACAKMIGHWLKETGDNDQSVLDAMQAAEQANPADPFPWIAGRLKPKEARETWDQRRIREGMEAIRQ